MLNYPILDDLIRVNQAHFTSTKADLIAFKKAFGFVPPPSYDAFCQTLGFGSLGSLIYVEPPLDREIATTGKTFRGILDTAPMQNAELARFITDSEAEGLVLGTDFLDLGELPVDQEFMQSLFYFGRSEMGHMFYWDISDADAEDARELPVYCILDYQEIIRVGNNFTQFLEAIFSEDNSVAFVDKESRLPLIFNVPDPLFLV